jgi:hypothetical protein
MLLAEDLLLLLLDDSTGKPVTDGTRIDHALAGAVLLELALSRRVDIAEANQAEVKKGRLVYLDPSPTGESVLDDALASLADKHGKKPENTLGPLGKGLRTRLLDNLAVRGILRRDEGRILGIFPTTRWPADDSRHEHALRAKLHDVLVVGLTPDDRTGALISLLSAIDCLPKVVDAPNRRALKRRGKEVAEGAWAAEAVRRAVAAVNAAATAAITAATVSTYGASGS